jgi:hypothetical protein
MIMGGSDEEKQDHPAQKPVLLYETPIRNHLRAGEVVYDPFVGSGTCIVAAETLGRRCYGMEIDPKYVQVSIERWQGLGADRFRHFPSVRCGIAWTHTNRRDPGGDRTPRISLPSTQRADGGRMARLDSNRSTR